MLLRRFYDDKLAQASYMIGCQTTGEAIIIDPHRDSDMYMVAAAEEDMTITYVSETHIHADYLSGSRQLAARTGAALLLSGDGDDDWQYGFATDDDARILHDGDEIKLGRIAIEILHTPGHTPEHISFMVTDGAASSEPLGVLTGDFIFVGDVGRPDLLERAAGQSDTMEDGARALFGSLGRFRDLPGHLQILPGHGAGSACGKALGSVPSSTLGYEQLVNWAFQCETEDDFVTQVLEDQPEPPRYFAQMKRMNRDGPPLLNALPVPERLDADGLAEMLAEGGVVVDTRDRARFAAGHVPGTISIPLTDQFTNRSGWLLPYDRPIYFVAEGQAKADEAARDLALIGIDATAGYFDEGALHAWSADHGELGTTRVVDWAAAEHAVTHENACLLDVRMLTEWNEGHAPEAIHVHLGYLRARTDELPRDRPLFLYCRTGSRSGIGTSLLQAEGFQNVGNVEGGTVDRLKRGLPMQ